MTVTINLPQHVEQASTVAAQTLGMTSDALVTDILVSHVPLAAPEPRPNWIVEQGIPVLLTGQPIDLFVVDDTLEAIRRDPDYAHLGKS